MELIEVLKELIGSVGFPIAACCVMFVQNNKLQVTLNQISLAMQALTDKINDLEKKVKED